MKEYFVWLAKLVTVIVLVFFVMPLVLGMMFVAVTKGAKDVALKDGKNTVAVIEITGAIESTKDVIEELYEQAKNDKVQGIVLRIDSPGGAVAPSQDVYSTVKKLKAKKPIVASFGSLAASGGLYSGLSASKIYCQPGTLTGSIGVIMQVPNFKKLVDWAGVQMITVKSGKLKDVGNSFRDMTPEEMEFLEKTATAVYEQFLGAVVEGRNLPREDVIKYADGRPILGSQAKEYKLVDEFGDVHDAARAVYDVLGKPLPEGEMPQLLYPNEKYSEIKKLLRSAASLPKIFSSAVEIRYEMK